MVVTMVSNAHGDDDRYTDHRFVSNVCTLIRFATPYDDDDNHEDDHNNMKATLAMTMASNDKRL